MMDNYNNNVDNPTIHFNSLFCTLVLILSGEKPYLMTMLHRATLLQFVLDCAALFLLHILPTLLRDLYGPRHTNTNYAIGYIRDAH